MSNELSDRGPSEFGADGDQQDQRFGVLSHPHRRFVLDNPLTVEMPVPVREPSAELVARKASVPDDSGDEGDAVEISLVHNHLPRTAEADLIEDGAAGRTVPLADRTAEVRAHLRAMEDRE